MRSFAILLIFIALLASACSLPSLETKECSDARETVKRFYSFHFGNDMHPSPENAQARSEFLTPELLSTLVSSNEDIRDYFTATENYPIAFRAGTCKSTPEQAVLQVVLLWKENTVSDQREVQVETVLTNGKWLINKVNG